MQLKIFIIPIKNVSEAEVELNGFLRGHRVLAVKKEFASDGENSFGTFCVEYLDGSVASSDRRRVPKVDYKEVLKPEEFEVFSRLRDWRKTTADSKGVPVYTVFTNEQLSKIVQHKIGSKKALQEIEGGGEARIKKYGDAVLRLMTGEKETSAPEKT